MKKINFATFNIGGGVPYKGTLEYNNASFRCEDYIANLISENKLDVVCFQEILMSDEHHNSMSKEIAEKSGLKYYKELTLSDSHIVKGRKMGVSILSRYKFVSDETFMLDNPNITHVTKSGSLYVSHEKGFLITKIQVEEQEIYCVTGHCIPYHSFDRDVMDFQYIYEKLERRILRLLDDDAPVIIGADFNTTRLSLLMPEVFQRFDSLVDVPTRPNGRGDDYILCDKRIVNKEFHLISTCYDHYGCMATAWD